MEVKELFLLVTTFTNENVQKKQFMKLSENNHAAFLLWCLMWLMSGNIHDTSVLYICYFYLMQYEVTSNLFRYL